MTSIKKVVAIVLAFLMIFSSASVLASAGVADFDGGTSLSIETKFFKQDASGEWVETERVAPGSNLKARVYVGTDYYSNDSTLLFFYDKEFFTHDYEVEDAVTVNPATDSFAQANGVVGYLNPTPNLTSIVNKGYITSDYLDTYGAIVVNLEVHADENETNVMYDASDWLFEIDFTVPTGVSGTDKALFVNPDTIQNTTNIDAVVNVPKGDSTGTDADLWPMWLWDADVTLEATPVSTESKVTFNANGGIFESDSLDSHEVTGTIDSALATHEEPKREGYTFLGWDDASTEGETAEAQPETFPELDLVLNAVWVKNVNITFVTGEGGTEIPALTDKTPGTAFPVISDPTRDGYTFLYWDTDNGELPDVYPDEDTTYTAVWALDVTMTIEPDNGNAATVIPGYAGQEFDPSTIADPEKEGYEFMGWDPVLPTQFPEASTTYTAIYEKKTFTVKYYIVKDGVATLTRAQRVMYGEVVPTDVIVPADGYELNGWYTDAALGTAFAEGTVMGASNLNLYGSYEVQTYNAVFNAAGGYFDGDTSKTEITVPTVYEEAIAAPADPAREGYVFLGWTPAVGVMDVEGDKTFYATWELEDNTVVYFWNNEDAPAADNNVYEQFTVAYTESVDIPADPTMDGYTFLYWGTSADAAAAAEIPADMPANGLEYYAIWEVNKYDVTFDANTGYLDDDTSKTTDTQNLEYKAAITAPTAKKAGYEFKGWALTADATVDEIVTVSTVPASDITYYAVWAPATAAYKVEYYMQDLNGNYVIDASRTISTTGTTEGTVSAPALTGLEGMFKLNDTVEGTKLEGTIAGDGSLVLKAYYEREKHTYTFTNTGDSTVADIIAYYDAPIEAPADPVWAGYTWVDWNPELPEKMGIADAEFEGTWTRNSYPVTFYANNGYLNDDRALTEISTNVEFEAAITQPTAKRDGYDFKGWATKADATADDVVTVPETMGAIDGGHTFYAVWEARTDTAYTVEYYMQGLDGVYAIDDTRTLNLTGETDESATAPALTDVTGMFELDTTVEGSNVTDTIDGDGSTVLKAYYKRLSHTYTFTNTGDTAIDPIVKLYGESVTEPVPTKEGHHWDGWTPSVPTVMGAEDMSFTGNWTPLSYEVTFYANADDATIDDAESKTISVTYGTAITAPTPVRSGYIHKGWATTAQGAAEALPETMPAEALTYYAVWEAQTGTPYKVEYYMQSTSGDYELDSNRTLNLQGETDSPVSAPDLTDVDGKFYLDTTVEGTELSGTIAGDGSTVLKAYYSRKQYTFKAYVNGEEVANETYFYNANVTAPEDPAKEGYEWYNSAWYSDADYTVESSVPGKMPANDVTLYARLDALDTYFTITVNYVDQKTGSEATAEVTSTYLGKTDSVIQIVEAVPETPAENTTYILISDLPDEVLASALQHYQYDADNATNLAFNATNTKIAGDGSTNINVYYEPVTYTVTFLNEDGSTYDTKTFTYYSNLELPAVNPEKDGYNFLGWYLGNTKVDETTKVEGNISYTAKFEQNNYTVKYVYTFEGSEENIPAAIAATLPAGTTTAHINDVVDMTDPAAVDGYTFEGWTSEGDVDGAVYTSDVTVTGNWVAIDRTVTYVYTFEGSIENIPAEITATLPAKVEGLHIGATVAQPVVAVDGYVFGGWTLSGAAEDGTVGTSDVTVTGNWTAIDRTITYVYTFEGNASGIPAEIAATLPAAVTGAHIGATVAQPVVAVDGYTFEGWNLSGAAEDGTVGTSDVTVTGNWVAIDRTITYVVDGDKPDGYVAPTGTTGAHIGDVVDVTAPEAVPGYTFSGWTVTGADKNADGDYVVDTRDVTVTGSWTHNVYKVTYVFTGIVPTTAVLPEAVDAYYGDSIVEPTVADIDGYTFEGWVVSGAGTDGKVGEGDVTVTGNWKYDAVSIVYEFAGVTAPEGFTVPEAILDAHIGQEVEIPTMTAPDGYTLVWTVSDTAVETDGKYYVDTATVTVTGTWAYVPYSITYTVTGDIPDGYSEPADITDAHIGQVIDQTQPAAVPGYTFTGWSLEGDVDGKVGTADVTVTGSWALNNYKITYTVTGDIPDGYSEPADITDAHIGQVIDQTQPAAVPGYTFTGWTLEGDVDGAVYTSDVTVTGSWALNNYKITYVVSGDIPDGYTKPAGTETAHIGDVVDVTAPEAVPGYTFSGWTLEGDVDGAVYTSDVTVTGSWTHNLYKVTYKFTGDVPATATLPAEYDAYYGDSIVEPTVADIEGYTFKGWNATGEIVDGKVGEGNVTVTGTWEINTYTVTYITNGGTPAIEADTYEYGAVINAPEETLTRAGYSFNYWYKDDENTEFAFGTETMPAGNITLYAKWTANAHTITFNTGVDGIKVETINTSYGAKVQAPEAPERAGYEFQYWYETDENTEFLFPYTAEDRDVVLNAKWYAIPVTIEYSYTFNGTTSVPAAVAATLRDSIDDAIIGDTVDETAPAAVHGYVFEGWTVTGAVEQADGSYKVGEETTVTVVGNWVYDTFTITYDMDGGDAMESTVANYNTVIDAPPATPNKLGSTFSHWVDADGATVTFPLTLKDNMALTAVWNKIDYTISFDENGGNTVADITANYGDDISALIPADEDMVRAGYTFGGWLRDGIAYTLPTVMPAENVSLVANWIADGDTTYIIKIYLMDTSGVYVEATDEQTTGSGATDTLATFNAPATREGFTLNTEKSTLSGTITAGDEKLVLSAYYDRNTHAVTFTNEYDDTYVGNTAATYYYDSIVTAPSNIPARTGYDFAGWSATVDGETITLAADGSTKVPDAAVNFVATWTEHVYTITYVSDGDASTVPEADQVAFGTATAKPALVPTKTGYTFAYWYETEGTEFIFGEAMPARDITLTAAWTANDVKVTYVFEGDVPTDAKYPVASKEDAHIGEVIDLTKPADVYGYTFGEWVVSGADKNEEGNYVVDTRDVTVTGTWTINEYTITFETGDGSDVADITKDYNTVVEKPTDPTLTGHTFSHWVKAGTTEKVEFPVTLTADMDLEAVWTTNTYYITYVTPSDATQVAKAEVKYGEKTTEPSEPQRTGYTFAGWYEDGATEKFVFGEAMPAKDITLTAAWTAIDVKVSYVFTGNVPESAEKPVGDKENAHIGDVIDLTEPADVAGYTFGGWVVTGADKNDEGNYVVDTREVVVTGNWTINSYTIKFADYDGTVLAESKLVYGSVITIDPADPVREGHTFTGWYATIDGVETKFADGATVPAADATFIAKYDVNSYNLKFAVDGTEVYNENIAYGTAFADLIPTAPAKDGYTFMGWALEGTDSVVDVPATMPASALSYVAVYETLTYNIFYYVKVVDGNDSTTDTYKAVAAGRVEYGSVIPADSNYVSPAEGYTFSGWYKDEALTDALTADDVMGTTTVKLYATETAIAYDAIFDANGGTFADDDSTSKTVSTFYEQEIVAPADPVRAGYEFTGWTPAVGVMDSTGKTFVAAWAPIVDHFSITYTVDGVDEVFYVAAEAPFESPADPYKAGYEFEGWAPSTVENPTADDVVDLPTVMPAENLAYTAVFTAVSANATFYEFKDTDRGPAYNTDSIGYDVYDQNAYIFGETIVMPAVPALVNTAGESIDAYYTFLHWVDDEGNTYAADAVIEMPEQAINFYPVYERVTVKLVPVEGSTTVIERYVDGAAVTESYNDNTVTADAYTGTVDFEQYFIYGLETKLDNSDNVLDEYIKVNGDGYYTVEYVTGTAVGTGVVIKVYDNFDTSAPVEEFHIVIFGDVTGDGYILAADANIVRLVVNDFTSLNDAWVFKAADVTSDGYILAADANIVRLVVNDFAILNQITGLAETV